MRATRLLPALAAAAVALIAPASASAQALPPSVTVDTNYAFSGVSKFDYTIASGISDDRAHGAGIDVGLDRHYAVGEGTTTDGDVAVVARRANGSLDNTFAGDGSLALPITTGERDFGTDMVVLPDGRLRILGSTDSGGAGGVDLVLIGLLTDGSPDPALGGGDGIEVFPAVDLATDDDLAARMAIAEDGRIAITGYSDTVVDEDAFVIVREPDGAAADFGTDGTVVLSGLGDERGVDVAWRGSGPVVLLQADDTPTLRAFEEDGDDDPAFSDDGELELEPGGVANEAGGLTVYGGRLWTTGSVDIGGDRHAFVARVDADGSGFQSRQFDMRGQVFPPSQQVASRGADLAVALGEPDTLVVVGSVTTDRGTEMGFAAFNLLDGDLAAMQTGDEVINVNGQGEAEGLATGPNGVVAVAGTLTDFSVETGSGSNDTSIGMARILIDSEKQCDLGLSIPTPLELEIRGVAPSNVTVVARNGGLRACGGTISVPAPYAMIPATLDTGKLAPGQSVTLTAQIGRPAPYPVEDTLQFTLASPTDAAPGDNIARVHVAFKFCDLRLVAAGSPRFIGNQGTRLFGFTVRNAGTEACRRTAIAVTGAGRRSGRVETYSVPAGQSVTDELLVRARRNARPGRRALIGFTALDATELLPADNGVRANPMVVRPGDSNARRPLRARRFSGTARDARTTGVRRRLLRLASVEIAVRRVGGKGCRWLTSADGGLRRVTPGRGGVCDAPVWVEAEGDSEWTLRLKRKLPKGRYQLLSRAITRNGVAEGRFTFGDDNKLRFRVR